jgi:hypothetical protein
MFIDLSRIESPYLHQERNMAPLKILSEKAAERRNVYSM